MISTHDYFNKKIYNNNTRIIIRWKKRSSFLQTWYRRRNLPFWRRRDREYPLLTPDSRVVPQ